MQTLLVYLLKAAVYSGILFSYYFLALRNKRFHYYNRFYLLMSIVMSLLLPFVNFAFWTWQSSNRQVIQLLNVMLIDNKETAGEGSVFRLSPELTTIVIAVFVALCLLLILLSNIIKIVRLKRRYPVEKIDNINFITTDLTQAPFSFFNNLFWKNTLSVSDTTGRQILKHEMTHIQQKHSWDKLFMRIITSVFWMNPCYWLMQKELSLIHEFIADETAIESKDAEAFALMLLQSQYSKAIFSPAQSFHYSPIKRRLLMLTTSKKPSFSYARRIMILPLLAASVLLFAFKLTKDKPSEAVTHANAPFTLVVDAGHGGNEAGAPGANDVVEKNINLSIAKKIQDLASGYGITVKMTRTDDATVSQQSRMNFIKAQHPDACISVHVNVTEEKQTSNNEVNVYVTKNDVNSNYVQSRLLGSSLLQTVKNHFAVNDVLMQRKQQGIYIIDQNPYPSIIFECGYMNNAASLKQLMDDTKVEQMARDILQGVVAYANADKSTAAVISDTTGKTPLYIVDGKEISAEEMKKIDANNIESINVLKDAASIKKYGEKGKDGVVLITMKKKPAHVSAKTDSSYTIQPSDAIESEAIIYVNGKEIRKEELNNFSPDNIESMTVWKGEEAIKKYGEKGRNGVIEIKLKADSSKKDSSLMDNIKSTSAEPE